MSKNASLSEQISSIRNQIIINKRSQLKDPTPSPMLWGPDGIDHINIWEQAETEIGKFLVHSSPYSIKHRYFGRFKTMEAFWHYIQSNERDDRIRNMSGPVLKKFSKQLTPARVVNFRAIVMDSNWQRIKQHPEQAEMVKESTLPFDCYFINNQSGIRTRPTFYKWLVMGFEEIRDALKEKREANFDFLLDVVKSTTYEFILPPQYNQTSEPEQMMTLTTNQDDETNKASDDLSDGNVNVEN